MHITAYALLGGVATILAAVELLCDGRSQTPATEHSCGGTSKRENAAGASFPYTHAQAHTHPPTCSHTCTNISTWTHAASSCMVMSYVLLPWLLCDQSFHQGIL